jgi:hypothetical protein
MASLVTRQERKVSWEVMIKMKLKLSTLTSNTRANTSRLQRPSHLKLPPRKAQTKPSKDRQASQLKEPQRCPVSSPCQSSTPAKANSKRQTSSQVARSKTQSVNDPSRAIDRMQVTDQSLPINQQWLQRANSRLNGGSTRSTLISSRRCRRRLTSCSRSG